jgi:3-isopropylmalate/(R)-2-methylmalate dehydratase small subunit
MPSGRVWKFGDDINTDLMLPGPLLTASEAEQVRAVFSANRPGWLDQVRPGDILIGGRNFGTGSSRPAARSLRNIGLGGLIAESINGLFSRNAVGFGFLALECRGIHDAFEEGHTAEISIADWTVRNCDTSAVLPVSPVPERLLSLMTGGGIFPVLEAEGLIGRKIAG